MPEEDCHGIAKQIKQEMEDFRPFMPVVTALRNPGMRDRHWDELSSTLKDPAALQEALKQLQDPAIQQQVKQMLEDPAFQQSMKQYMEQITKDPQFEALKKQTEAMMQEEGFVESMTKAFSDMGAAFGDKEGEDKEE